MEDRKHLSPFFIIFANNNISRMLLSLHVCRKMAVLSLFFSSLFIQNSGLKAQGKTYGLLKKISGNDENGYVLFSPLNCDTTYLINKCGQRVHHWVSPFTPGMSLYLQPNGHLIKTGTYTDTAFGVAGGRGGIIEEYDWNNQLIWRYKIFNDSLCQHHDIKPMPNGNVMVLAWHSISKQKAMDLGRRSENFKNNQTDLWGERLIELKPIGIDSAEIVWQWDLFDHVVQDVDTALPNYGRIDEYPELVNINYALNLQTNDWIHANGIDYNEDLDQVVISCHNVSEIWIIDHSGTTAETRTHRGGQFDKGGDLLYRWGNPAAYNMGGTQDRKLFRQHHAYWIPNGYKDSGCIMLFNNGFNRDTAYSTVEVIQTPVLPNGSYASGLPYAPTAPKWLYKDSVPTNFYSQIISGAERMPNGNTIICSGVQGLFFEVTPTGKTVWKYKNPLAGNLVKSDATTGNNPVFRCTFYPASYPAFAGKTLSGGRVLEKNPLPYSCLYEGVSPVVTALMPAKNSTGIAQDTVLKVIFSETVLKASGTVSIYANNQLYESISVGSDLVSVQGNVMQIKHLKKFPFNARIAVKVAAKTVRDSSFNFNTIGVDTIQWHFETKRSQPIVTGFYPDSGQSNVSVKVKPYLVFDAHVRKQSGSIKIYENGRLTDSMDVNSQRVVVTGNVVSITPLKSLGYNTTIHITLDACLSDTLGVRMVPISGQTWTFKTQSQAQILSLSPQHLSKDNESSTLLTIRFDKALSVDSVKSVKLFENGVLIKQIPLNDAAVTLTGSIMSIDPRIEFKSGARVGVYIPSNSLVDASGAYFQGVDTAQWKFSVRKINSVLVNEMVAFDVYPNPSIGDIQIVTEMEINQLELMSMQGDVFLMPVNRNENGYTLSMQTLAPGVYLLRINSSHTIKISKS